MSALNRDQNLAATCLDRRVFVAAGAGSGKTRMLAQRFVNAAVPDAANGWEPAGIDEIVAITFTDKAAGEIAERVRLALQATGRTDQARKVTGAWISTIHGLCSRLLRRHALEVGIDPMFSVGDAVAVGQLRDEAFEAAARRLSGDEDVLGLLERYGYQAVFSACGAVVRELAVLGDRPEGIRLEPCEPAAKLLDDAERLLRRGMTSCDLEYGGVSNDPMEHAVRCEELLGACNELAGAETHQESLEGLLHALASYKPLKRLKGLEAEAAELAAAKADIVGRVAAALVSPWAAGFKRLVIEYSDEYEARKAVAGLLDFDDLQIKTAEFLERRPDLAQRYRDQFRVVMIDEFQDTDALQLRLVEALSDANLCTVGDEKQSIYRFRGADVEVYKTHRAQMEADGALVVQLDVNYRSHPEVLDFVNTVFGSDAYFGSGGSEGLLRLRAPADRAAGPLDEVFSARPRVEAIFVDSTDVAEGSSARTAEATCVARRLGELCTAGVRPGDIAVLLRFYSHAHEYAEALSREGLPAVIVGGSRFFGLREIAVMRALNRAIANPEDGRAIGVLVASDFAPLSSDALAILRLGRGVRDPRSLWSLLGDRSIELERADREVADRLAGVLENAAARLGSRPLAEVLLLAVEEMGWDLRLLSGGNTGRDAFANVLKFARQAAAFDSSAGTGAVGFAAHLDARERLGDTEAPATLADDHSDAVRIMSIHASKGLEFPVVVVPELAARHGRDVHCVRTARDGSTLAVALKTPPDDEGESRPASGWFSAFAAEEARADAEEDARVLYVAFTRAREALLVSGSMRLRPKQRTTANNHLVRLAGILGLAIPVTGPQDIVVSAPTSSTSCRLRVIDASEVSATDARDESVSGPRLPAVAAPETREARQCAGPSRLSYTQLSEFEHCPRRYWVRRVIGVRTEADRPDGEVGPLAFGTALHTVLRQLGPAGEPPAAERIESIGRHFELSLTEQERLSEAVKRYCGSETARRAVALGDVVRRESPFSMRIGGRFLLIGSIDLYSRKGSDALVVDYKSGTVGEDEDLAVRYRLQAECYALAVLRDGCDRVTVEFVRPEVETADSGIGTVAFEFVSADAERIEADLLRRYREIELSDFEPAPSQECANCGVIRGLCPSSREQAS